jgi:hypothetical protein
MAIPDPNWPRWIVASVSDYFKDVSDDIELPLLVEGVDEREAEKIRAMNHFELRIHGPETKEVSKGYFRIFVEINLLVTSFIGGQQQNAHEMVQFLGLLQQAASEDIPVYRFGLTPGVDDDTFLGCLKPDSARSEVVTVFNFGEIDRARHIRQSAVDGRYRMELTT